MSNEAYGVLGLLAGCIIVLLAFALEGYLYDVIRKYKCRNLK